jgi:hypothetical protein
MSPFNRLEALSAMCDLGAGVYRESIPPSSAIGWLVSTVAAVEHRVHQAVD